MKIQFLREKDKDGNRIPSGPVHDVPDEKAQKYIERGIAIPAATGTPSVGKRGQSQPNAFGQGIT